MVNLDEVKSVAILGDINSSKTNLAVKLLRDYKGDKKIYVVGYPKRIDDFKIISSFEDLFKLTDSIIFIDEIQKYINIYDRRRVQEFIELISFFAHNNNVLIFTTCLSYFIPKRLDPYLDSWCLTRIRDIKGLKNGSKIKRIIQDIIYPGRNRWSLALKKGEYIEYSELNEPEDNGLKTFKDQKIGKDWRLEPPKIKLVNEKIPKIIKDSEQIIKKKKELGSKPVKTDLTDNEISKLAWGNLNK